MRKYTTRDRNNDLYIGTCREMLSLIKSFEKKGIAINPFTSRPATPRGDMGRMASVLITYYSEYEMKYLETPLMYIISTNSALAELNYKDYRKEW